VLTGILARFCQPNQTGEKREGLLGWYQVTKTIKGHRYIYLQRTWREGKHVRTESRYIGPADGGGGRASGKRDNRAESEPKPVNTTAAITPELVEETFAELLRERPTTPPWRLDPGAGYAAAAA
jgi:hypothetical protein